MNDSTTSDRVRGIDVSVWQRQIDWKKVSFDPQQFKFAFIRISDGLRRDSLFETNWVNARANTKLITGIYQYFDVHQDAEMQADMILSAYGDASSSADGRTLPPVLDVEKYEDARPMPEPAVMVEAIYKWVSKIKGAIGVPPIIYTNSGTWDTYVKSENFNECPLWVANHTKNLSPLLPSPWKKLGWEFWQYSRTGKVQGISGDVDLNVFQGNEDRLRLFCERRC